jgi:hypothetical protein
VRRLGRPHRLQPADHVGQRRPGHRELHRSQQPPPIPSVADNATAVFSTSTATATVDAAIGTS